MIKRLKTACSICISQWPTLLLFIIGYQMITYSIFYSSMSGLMSLMLKTLNVSYLSMENIFLVFTNPITFLCSLGLVLFLTACIYVEFVGFYLYCEAGWKQEKLSIFQLIKKIIHQCKSMLHISNALLFFGFIITTIVTILPFSPFLLNWLRVPEFILEYIQQKDYLYPLYLLFITLSNILGFFFMFVFSKTIVDGCSIKEAITSGVSLIKKRKLRTIGYVVFAFLLFAILVITTLIIGNLFLVLYANQDVNSIAYDTFTLYFNRFRPATVFVVRSLATVWFFSFLVTLYHEYQQDVRVKKPRKISLKIVMTQAVLLFCAAIILVIFGETELGGTVQYRNSAETEIVVHRAGGVYAPENTLAAVDKAIEMKADIIEIDVQQLKDGTIVLLHDNNFLRTTGNDKNVWEVTYDEVKTYDAGSYYLADNQNEPVPTLEDVLKRAKGKVNVMIEIKLNGHEKDMVKQVLALVEKYDMVDQCDIGSLNLQVLKESKEINPKIDTVYITPLIFSGQYDIDYVDAFSVETTIMTRDMVTSIQMQHKKVYGWTANSKNTIDKNLRAYVDGIVTDDPKLVKYYAQQAGRSQILNALLDIFYHEELQALSE